MTNGTEKQIMWATQIQKEFVETFTAETDKCGDFLQDTLPAMKKIGEKKAASGENTQEQIDYVVEIYTNAFENLKSNDDAMFWIDNRDVKYLELVSREVGKNNEKFAGKTSLKAIFHTARK